MSRYLDNLNAAKQCERRGELVSAIRLLAHAENQTQDEEELKHVRIWRERLEREWKGKNKNWETT